MNRYTYAYQADSSREIIGRVMATSLREAREMISQLKQLDIDSIIQLFDIQEERDHENETYNSECDY